jgi:GNAT superfamily N-acetyltransferase
MSEFVIRPGVAGDLPAVVGLVRALADFEKLPGPDADAEARFIADFPTDRYRLLVADLDGRVVGYALYFMTYSTFLARPSLYLEDLFVLPEARRHGIGTAFLKRLIEQAATTGCGRFEWTVLDWNEPAQAFYRSLGAEVLPDWRICRLEGETLLAAARRL